MNKFSKYVGVDEHPDTTAVAVVDVRQAFEATARYDLRCRVPSVRRR